MVYNDIGAGEFSLAALENYFQKENIVFTNAKELRSKPIPEDIDYFIMPGGADIPYHRDLNGIGNQTLQNYISNGGTYIGICAGAYYASDYICFQHQTENAICEKRNLQLFKGTARGCLSLAPQKYNQNLLSSNITKITIGNNSVPCFYWGGCEFISQNNNDIKLIGTYNNLPQKSPALISGTFGKGKYLLSGVHFEVSNSYLSSYNFKTDSEKKYQENILKSDVELGIPTDLLESLI